MRYKRTLLAVGALFGQATGRPEPDESEQVFRHIWHYLNIGSENDYPLKRKQTNVLVLQMGKVASSAIRAALCERGVNAFHTHGLSPAPQQAMLSHLLAGDPTFRLAAQQLRRHVQHLAMHMLVRWYQAHKQYRGRRLKVITLTRDPVTHYPSGLLDLRLGPRPDMIGWCRARSGLGPLDALDEARAMTEFITELASIIAEGRPSAGAKGHQRCIALARQRWPEHPVVAAEVAEWLRPLSWFDDEIAAVFGLDMLAPPELRERGWAERSNDWVDILALKFEALPAVAARIRHFLALPELILPRANVTSVKPGAECVARAMQAVLATDVGQACARELRISPYGRACGYDRLAVGQS
jgi:hypothetical protein